MRRVEVPTSPELLRLGSEHGGWLLPDGVLDESRSIAEARALLELLRADGFELCCRKDPSSFTLMRR